ncbi:MAG: hypothetical protein ACYCO9_16280 [Streptosporangiaceae bacterium]
MSTIPQPNDVLGQVIAEKYAAQDEVRGLASILHYLCGRYPAEMAAMMAETVASQVLSERATRHAAYFALRAKEMSQ